jgi:electron transfer flavoprotein alpha/beta subunit
MSASRVFAGQRCRFDRVGEVEYRRTMSRAEKTPAVLTIRIDADLIRALAREARRRRKTKSEVAREILAAGLGAEEGNLIAQEARHQSLLVSRRSEREAFEFIEQTADTRGWR